MSEILHINPKKESTKMRYIRRCVNISEFSALRSRQARLEGGVEQERGALKDAERRRERLHRALATVDARLHQENELREAASREADAAQTHLLAKLKVGLDTVLRYCPINRLLSCLP